MEAAERVKKGGNPVIEIMIPLTITQPELTLARQWCEDAIAAQKASKKPLEVTIGTMIETPRACLRADDIALEADFLLRHQRPHPDGPGSAATTSSA